MSSQATILVGDLFEIGLLEAFYRIYRHVRNGRIAGEDVTTALERGWGPEIADAWREYIKEEQ